MPLAYSPKMLENCRGGRRKSTGLEKQVPLSSFCFPVTVRRSKSLPRMQRKKSVHWSDELEDIHYFQPGTNRFLCTAPTEKKSRETKENLNTGKSRPGNSQAPLLGRRRGSLPHTTKTKFETIGFLRAKKFCGNTNPKKISEEKDRVQCMIDVYESRRATLPIINPKDLRQLIEFEQGDWV